MWSYYGSKSKIVKCYPKPEYNKIIEPFAGTAQYSLLHFDNDILITDKYDVIIKVWKWLQQCSQHDILSLPRLEYGETTDDYSFDCIEAKWFVGMIITGGPTQPKKTASKWKTVIRPNTQNYKINFAAKNLWKIKHWKIECCDYKEIKNQKATWFIDPQYQHGGRHYKHHKIDYEKLKKWCIDRYGKIIVCENSKANWLPFVPLVKMRGSKYTTTESVFIKRNSIQTGEK